MVFNLRMFNGFKPIGIMVKQYYTAAALCFFWCTVSLWRQRIYCIQKFPAIPPRLLGRLRYSSPYDLVQRIQYVKSRRRTRLPQAWTVGTELQKWSFVLGTYMMLSIFDISNMMGSLTRRYLPVRYTSKWQDMQDTRIFVTPMLLTYQRAHG